LSGLTGKAAHRLLVLETSASMGGVQHSTFNLLKDLDSVLWQSIVLCPKQGQLTELLRAEGIEFRILRFPNMKSTSIWIRGISRIPNPLAWLYNLVVLCVSVRRVVHALYEHRADLLLTKGMQSHVIGGAAAKRAGIPCVWHVQDLLSERMCRINVAFATYLARRYAHAIIADGEAIRQQYPPDIQSRTTVVLNGVDTNVFTPGCAAEIRNELHIPDTAVVLGHVARITPWKGQMHVLQAYFRIADACPQLHLLYVGDALFDSDAYYRRLRTRAEASPYTDRIHFAGYRDDLPDMLRAIDIAAYTSLEKDTSPLALLSAMAAALPVVAYDIQGVREVLSHEENGILIRNGDIDALAEALKQLALDGEVRNLYAAAARNTALARFDTAQYVQQCEQVLLTVVLAGIGAATGVA